MSLSVARRYKAGLGDDTYSSSSTAASDERSDVNQQLLSTLACSSDDAADQRPSSSSNSSSSIEIPAQRRSSQFDRRGVDCPRSDHTAIPVDNRGSAPVSSAAASSSTSTSSLGDENSMPTSSEFLMRAPQRATCVEREIRMQAVTAERRLRANVVLAAAFGPAALANELFKTWSASAASSSDSACCYCGSLYRETVMSPKTAFHSRMGNENATKKTNSSKMDKNRDGGAPKSDGCSKISRSGSFASCASVVSELWGECCCGCCCHCRRGVSTLQSLHMRTGSIELKTLSSGGELVHSGASSAASVHLGLSGKDASAGSWWIW